MSRIKKVRKKKINAFTLIELMAVLVILAVISLIVAPLLLNTIRRVKDVANKRSVDGYGRAVEYAMADYQLVHLAYPDNFDKLEIEYKGNKVECKTSRINPDYSIYLSECKVNGKLVKDDKEIDGYYHYGILKMTNQEYVDTYGKNLEDALKKYHDEHNEYPSDYTTLELPPLDKEVSCDVSINYDGTVYLTRCSVDNEMVLDNSENNYKYGEIVYRPYKVGDYVTYNDVNYYVIADSDKHQDYITLLKAEPFKIEEVNTYGVGHINKYTFRSAGEVFAKGIYGGTAYYSSDRCGYVNNSYVLTNCITDYNQSDVKYIIDSWASEKINSLDLAEDNLNYKIRLITVDELRNNLGYGESDNKNSDVPAWVYDVGTTYWTMSQYNINDVYRMNPDGRISKSDGIINYGIGIRPVINLKKSALE